MPAVRAIMREAAARDYRFSSLVLGVVHSTPFTMRVAQPPAVVAAGSSRPSVRQKAGATGG
jgi:hypothetical protein